MLYIKYYWWHLNLTTWWNISLDEYLIWLNDLLLYCLYRIWRTSLKFDEPQRFCQIVKLKALTIIPAVQHCAYNSKEITTKQNIKTCGSFYANSWHNPQGILSHAFWSSSLQHFFSYTANSSSLFKEPFKNFIASKRLIIFTP